MGVTNMAYSPFDIKHYVQKFTNPDGEYTVSSRGGVSDAAGACKAPAVTCSDGGFQMPGDYWPVRAHYTQAILLSEFIANVLKRTEVAFVEAANSDYFTPYWADIEAYG
jgi:hypothetical protein